jgi:hypothetical protein
MPGNASLADSKSVDTAVDALRLGNSRRDFKGVLFFDVQDLPPRYEPSSLEVFFTDVSTGKVWHVTAKYPKTETAK